MNSVDCSIRVNARWAVLLMLWLLLSAAAHAQSDRPRRIVVPANAGGPLDVMARVLATALARDFNEPVIVDNRPGASGIIGTEYVVNAPADGRTLVLVSGFVITNAVLTRLSFDPLRDLAPVIELPHSPMVLVARNGLGADGPADLRRVAQSQPGGLNCAAPPGEMALACEQLKQLLGGAVMPVPYAGVVPAMNALLGAQVDLMFAPADFASPHVEGRRIVPIATAGDRPSMAPFDKVPLLMDTWPGFSGLSFLGILAPAGTPREVVRAQNRALNRALMDPVVRDYFVRIRGSVVEDGTPPEKLAATLASRYFYYRRLADTIGLKPQ